MWLRNYYNMLTALFLADDTLSSSTQPTDYTPPIMVHRVNDTWVQANSRRVQYDLDSTSYISYIRQWVGGLYFGKEACTYGTYPQKGFSIQCGSGTTPATYDDYKLETPITSGLSVVSAQGTLAQATQYDNVTHHVSSKRSFTINNTSANSITVSEIGIFVDAASSSGDGACIYRDVFTPITLAPGESAIVSFERDAEVYNYTPY